MRLSQISLTFLSILTLACDADTSPSHALRDGACLCEAGTETLTFTLDEGLNTLEFNGSSRQYRVRYPNGFDPGAWQPGDDQLIPVFHFHSCGKDINDNYYDSFRHRGFLPVTIGAASECWDLTPEGPDLLWAQAAIEGIEAAEFPFLDVSQRFMGGIEKGGYMSQVVGCRLGADAIASGNGGLEDIERTDFREWAVTTPAPETCVNQPALFINHGLRAKVTPLYPAGCFERASAVTYEHYEGHPFPLPVEDPEGEYVFQYARPHLVTDENHDFFGESYMLNGDCVYQHEVTGELISDQGLDGTRLDLNHPTTSAAVGANVLGFWTVNNECPGAWHEEHWIGSNHPGGQPTGVTGPLENGSVESVTWCGDVSNPEGVHADGTCGCMNIDCAGYDGGGNITFCFSDDDGGYFPEHKESAERLFYSVLD